jgi:hypothetical protein
MNTKIVLGSIGGAALLHALLAACSSASAQSAPSTQVDVESCDKTAEFPATVPNPDGGLGNVPGSYTFYYAEAAFPGLTAAQLAGHVTNWNTVLPSASNVPPTGYQLQLQTNVFVKDGFVGAGCSQGTQTTFVYAP